ncbi:LPXTG cell wall anchor domain-containing protein [Enterococcus faecalis]|nr:LPXTG cell wall anchor domain-containing protein [Enterococcus faecalis]
MKKMILGSLFSATVLLGMVGTSAYADTTSPGDPSVPPTEIIPPTEEKPEVPEEPILPPVEGGEETPEIPPVENPDTGGGEETPEIPPVENPDTGGGEETPEVPPVENPDTGGGEVTPEVPENPGNGGNTETPEKPSNPGGNEGTTPPTTPPTNNGGTATTPPVQDVVVNPDGSVGTPQTGGQTVQIETNNASELTHIPTPSTPIETASGEKIVSVVDGVAYKETEEGLKPISDKVEQLPSGNIAVKGSDGKMKILPKTGEELSILATALGGLMASGSGFAFWRKRKAK